jgi:hypothetical protein
MGKRDERMRTSRDVLAESMGSPRATPMHGTSAAAVSPTPVRFRGIARGADERTAPPADVPCIVLADTPQQEAV